jgi:hypothetical protein
MYLPQNSSGVGPFWKQAINRLQKQLNQLYRQLEDCFRTNFTSRFKRSSKLSETQVPDSEITPELGALLTAINKHLPFEIVSKILDYAELWYCDQSVTLPRLTPESLRQVVPPVHWRGSTIGKAILTSRPLSPQDISLLRRVTFSFRSKGLRKQLGRYESYNGSWTWWEARVLSSQERMQLPDPPSVARTYHVQYNQHAGKDIEDYTIAFNKWHGHQLFEDICPDDSIVLVACARFPGWAHYIESASLQLWMADVRRAPPID